MASAERSTRFRPELEGLRGVAVLLVIAAHAGVAFPGAAIGPDLFFVLSGYLITGLLLRRLDAGRGIELGAFYARRLRRLLPAAIAAIALTVLALLPLGDPFALARAARDGIAALTGTANIHFALGLQDYFAPIEPSVFLPLWSLGVEEQFCLIVPLLVGLAYRIGGRRLVGGLLALIAVGSVVAAGFLTISDPVWAYYLLPTRAYALALGGLLALGEARLIVHRRSAGLLALLGVGVLVAILVLVPGEDGYPGLVGPLAALGSAALIGGSAVGGPLSAALAVQPLRLVGRISYSLFLLHWPFLVVPAMYGLEMTPAQTALAVLGAFVAATLLYLAVERPFRDGRLFGERPRQILPRVGGVAATSIALLAALNLPISGAVEAVGDEPPIAIAIVSPSPTLETVTAGSSPTPSASPTPPPTGRIAINGSSAHQLSGPLPADLRPALRRAAGDADRVLADGCGWADSGTSARTCRYGTLGGPRIAIVGTSHAAHWIPALERIAEATGWEINPYVKVNCPFVDYEVRSARLGRIFTECTVWRERVIEALNENPPTLVIIASARHSDPSGRVDTLAEAADAVGAMIRQIKAPVALFADNPYGQVDIPSCLARNRDNVADCAVARGRSAYGWSTKRDLLVGERFGVPVFDFTPSLCPGSRCAPIIDGIVVYHDHHHLTVTMSRHLAPALATQLVPLVEALRAGQ